MPVSKYLDPKSFAPFTLYALLLSIVGALTVEVLKDLLDSPAGAHKVYLWVVWGAGVVILGALFKIYDPAVRRFLEAPGMPEHWAFTSSATVRPARGLVLLVSSSPSGLAGCLDGVAHHQSVLKHLWLIHSSDADSIANVEKIEEYCRSLGLLVKTSKRLLDDLFSIEMTKAHIEFVREEAHSYGIEDRDLIYDFTGMTKPASAGVVLACIRPEHRLQYMEPRGFREDGSPDPKAGSVPVEVDIRYDVELVAESRLDLRS